MKTKSDYFALQVELTSVEQKTGVSLTDIACDWENSGHPTSHLDDIDDADFWRSMYGSACSAAGERATEVGLDINALIGRIIY